MMDLVTCKEVPTAIMNKITSCSSTLTILRYESVGPVVFAPMIPRDVAQSADLFLDCYRLNTRSSRGTYFAGTSHVNQMGRSSLRSSRI